MISSLGSSGIDSLLQSYRYLEEKPIRALEDQKKGIDKRISLIADLKSKLKKLESLAKDLSYTDSSSIFGTKAISLSDESYFTATVTSSAIVTPHEITVQQLAKADKIVSNQYTLSDTNLATTLGAGTYTFEVTVNGNTVPVSVDIAADDDNETILNNIISAINSTSDIGIRASLVKDSETTGRLVFTSEETGADYEMSLSDTSGSLLSTLGMDDSTAMSGTSGGYVYDSSELNAVVLIDGMTIQRNSNEISDAISGVTLNLKKTHASGEAPVTLDVDYDQDKIKSKIQEFIDAYNDVLDFIKKNTGVDSSTHERSALSGDFTVTNMKLKLRTMFANPVTGLDSGNPTIFADLGITTDRDGKLSISDSEKLDELLNGGIDKIASFFNSSDGIATRLTDFLDEYTDGEGVLEKRKDVLQNQINLLNGRIERMEKSVDRKMDYYREQFSQLQAAYSMYSSQSAYIGTMMQSGFIYY
ncbi:MAG: flagellar filament capping protein FliD [Calditrichia bacterium]